jgi:hypothetical protein
LINPLQNFKRFHIIGDYLPTKANDRMQIRRKMHNRKEEGGKEWRESDKTTL